MSLFPRKPADYYVRPHCPNCKTIWKKDAFSLQGNGFVIPLHEPAAKCPKCGKKIVMKDFNPWSRISDTLLQTVGILILYAVVSLIISAILSVIGVIGWSVWVYGMLIPLGLFGWMFNNVNNGFRQWDDIKKLEKKHV